MQTHRLKRTLSRILAVSVLAILPISAEAHATKLPLGDGKISNHPRQGYVFSCQQRFNPNARGAHRSGDWIKGAYWYPDLKPEVDGSVGWSGGGVTVRLNGALRQITGKGLPEHETGIYPIRRSDDAYYFDRNPNRIRSQRVTLTLPANPEPAERPSCVPMAMIGVSLTGATIFNALDAPGRDAVAHEIQDKCNGHPERRGQYHYHGPSDCMIEEAPGPGGHSGLVGYALDGFGLYGLKGQGGKALTNADLDACHGHTGPVNWNGRMQVIYHYHLTEEYPYTIGCFKGQPVRIRR